MKMIKRMLIIIFIIFCIVNVFKFDYVYGKVDLSTDVGNFNSNLTQEAKEKTGTLVTIVSKFLGFLRIISALILVLVIGTTGYRYIIATPDVKWEIQKKMLPIILSIILIFAASSIAGFILEAIGG